ncbi:MAG: S8 family serine peptidase [Crocinitomicaceae bacterium]|nr:S8 family serine peptidase [Crocinitomicaceae bacterium]
MKKTLPILIGLMMMFSLSVSAQQEGKPGDYVPGDLIVQTLPSASIREIVSRAPVNYGLTANIELSPTSHIWQLGFDHTVVSHKQMLFWLYSQPEIELAQNNYYLELRSTIPNDASFSQQWHHNNTGQTGGTTDADIDSDLAWDITTGGTTASGHDIVVCLIESGNLDHNDITGNRWFNVGEIANNGIDDDANGYTDDYDGWNPVAGNDNYGTGNHGTNCLGMIGAKGNNNNLVVGANWDVKLMVVGGYSISTDANAIQAYQYPYDMRVLWNTSGGTQGAFVVATSSSWGIDQEDPNNHPVWCNFYGTMGVAGILNVGATTNSNLNVDVVGDMPTACATPYMIGVGRTDHDDNTAGGYGATTIEFGAPGINVVTTANTNTTTTTTGTSFSCPLTAGVIGLAYSIPCTDFMNTVIANPQAGADLVLQAMLDGCDVKPALMGKFVTDGRLNSRNTLDELMLVACNGTICFAPSAISTGNIGDLNADISFTPAASAISTTLYWRLVGAPTWTTVTNATSPVNLTGLTGCSDYEYYLETDCGGGDISGPTSTQTFSTTGCGACIDLPYCTGAATDGVDEWISDFSIDTYTNTSGNDGGFGDYTGSNIQLDVNNTYPVNIGIGWAGTLYDEYTRVWIDLDQSGTFDPSEIVFDQGAASQVTPITGNITIPPGATLGTTRMRVQMAYIGSQTLPIDACQTFQWGEVEDYCVTLNSGIVCGLTVASASNDPACAGVDDGDASVNVTGGSGNYTYTWTPNVGSTASVSNLADGGYSVVVADVTAGCDTTINFTLNYTTAINVTVNTTDVSCNGAGDGSAVAVASGGTSYTYQWIGGPASDTYSGLGGGSYTVDVTDVTGCTGQASGTVSEPAADQASFGSNITFLDVTFNNTSTTGTYLWDFGDGNTSTSANPTHSYATPGTYTVCLTVTTGCGTTQVCHDVTVDEDDSAVDENLMDYISVFPIPASEVVNFQITNAKLVSIEIVDIIGKVVAQKTVNSEMTQFEIGAFNDGTYFYRILDGSGSVVITDKLMIVK